MFVEVGAHYVAFGDYCLSTTTIVSVEQRRFSLSYKKVKSASPQVVMETAVGVQRAKKGIFPCFEVIMKADICWLFIIKNQRMRMILIFLQIR